MSGAVAADMGDLLLHGPIKTALECIKILKLHLKGAHHVELGARGSWRIRDPELAAADEQQQLLGARKRGPIEREGGG